MYAKTTVLTLLAVLLLALVRTSAVSLAAAPSPAPRVTLLRTPNHGIQPQAIMSTDGVLHLIYFTGPAPTGDVDYVTSADLGSSYSDPLRVNSQPKSVIAVGNIRGAQLALGRQGRVHVAWMGAKDAGPKAVDNSSPMLYARLNDDRTAFEPQRNVVTAHAGLDGGGSVAADDAGNVYVVWHGHGDVRDEAHRMVWVAHSHDDGRTFEPETAAWAEPTGCCACCGIKAGTDLAGNVYILYRSARQNVHRDEYLLTSTDQGRSFAGRLLHPWLVDHCVMSSASIAASASGARGAWETENQVYFGPLDRPARPAEWNGAPGKSDSRRHPAIAVNALGQTLLAWSEGVAWSKGGSLAWQVFDRDGKPIAGLAGEQEGVPTWSFVAAVARPDGGFIVVY